MSYLRFTPEEYGVICRLCEQIPLGGTDITALRHFLVAYMPLDQLGLARRIARLDRRQMRLLHEDLLGQSQTKTSAAPRAAFTEEELQTITRTIDLPRRHPRFLRLFHRSVVERLSDAYPSLAWK